MKKINLTISDKAYEVLESYKKAKNLRNKDSALESLLLEHGTTKTD